MKAKTIPTNNVGEKSLNWIYTAFFFTLFEGPTNISQIFQKSELVSVLTHNVLSGVKLDIVLYFIFLNPLTSTITPVWLEHLVHDLMNC